MMSTFKIFWVMDAIGSLIVLYFFVIGLADGTVSSYNAGIWAIILLMLLGIVGGSIWLKNLGYIIPAILVLLVMAVPAIFYLLYMLIFMFGNGRMN